MKWFSLFRNDKQAERHTSRYGDVNPISIGIEVERKPARLDFEKGVLYRFKRDVLLIVAKLNQGVLHQDCEVLKRQTIFVQTQLFHSLYHDHALPVETREMLMKYHLRSVKATIGDKRSSKERRDA